MAERHRLACGREVWGSIGMTSTRPHNFDLPRARGRSLGEPQIKVVMLVLIVFGSLASGLFPGRALAADLAATVLLVQGKAVAATAGGERRPLFEGSDIYVGERVVTAGTSRLRMRLIDGAVITLGDHSTFSLVGYQAPSKGFVLDLFEGVFRAVSGSINEQQPKPLTVRTPLGLMGVRGTTFWGRHQRDHLEVALLEGGDLFVSAQGIRVVLDEPTEGTDVYPGQPPTAPKPWGQSRLDAAAAMVAFD